MRLDFDDELEYVFRTGVQLQALTVPRDAGADFFVDHGYRGRVPAGGARFALEDGGGAADGVTAKKQAWTQRFSEKVRLGRNVSRLHVDSWSPSLTDAGLSQE